MSILIDRNTPVIVQGITGKMARFHTKDMVKYGTNVVGGVVPGKGGMEVEGLPVFDTVADAVENTGAEASLVFVPPPFAADSIMEAADAGIKVIIAITEGIPIRDMIRVNDHLKDLLEIKFVKKQVISANSDRTFTTDNVKIIPYMEN